MTHRVYNFSAGPSVLPEEVLKQATADIFDYDGSGMSVMEMSHRSKTYGRIIEEAEADLRTLMTIPDDYDVLFLQGGATLQFSMVPLNLLNGTGKADYVVTGSWADKAAKEAAKYGDVRIAASSADANYSYIPKLTGEDFRADIDYVHTTYNNTIFGTRWSYVPDTGNIPLVSDMSSGILAEQIDVSKYALIYAGAQKNIAPAGLTLVIVRKDFIGHARDKTPVYLDYKIHADNGSMYNTPPAWNIYMAGLVFKHLIKNGGLRAMEAVNRHKAGKLYKYIDESKLYTAPAKGEDRSLMNVVFVTGDEALDKKFVEEGRAHGLIDIGGHRQVGGMRASIYNAMPEEGVDALIAFMKEFEADNL
jgi:phosphoserine aminotransferase